MMVFGALLMLGLVVALALRLSWARPVLLGQAVTGLVWTAAFATLGSHVWALATMTQLAAVALLMPWRRSKLGDGGWALALLVPAYAAGEMFGMWKLSLSGGGLLQDPLPMIVLGSALMAGAGVVLRARWAAPAAAVCAVALASMGHMLLEMTWRFEHPELQRAISLGILGLGVCGAALGAVFAWRSARESLGTFKYVLG